MATGDTIELDQRASPEARSRVVTELEISGMTCGNCARHVTEAIQNVPGVQSATVSLDARQASVRWAMEGGSNVPAVIKAVKEAGYEAHTAEVRAHDHGGRTLANWQMGLWIGVIGTALMMSGEWVFGLGVEHWFRW